MRPVVPTLTVLVLLTGGGAAQFASATSASQRPRHNSRSHARHHRRKTHHHHARRAPTKPTAPVAPPAAGCPPFPADEPGAGVGWIIGCITVSGGPAPGSQSYGQQGTVSVTNATGQVVATQAVGEHQSYSIAVAPGQYSVSAVIPNDFPCPAAGQVAVAAGREARQDVNCSVP